MPAVDRDRAAGHVAPGIRSQQQQRADQIIHIAQPPLYKISAGRKSRWAFSEAERNEIVEEMNGRSNINIQRYKGLGEMSGDQLWETTMNPETRTLLQIAHGTAAADDEIFSLLMGDVVEPRRNFIQAHALDVKNLDV